MNLEEDPAPRSETPTESLAYSRLASTSLDLEELDAALCLEAVPLLLVLQVSGCHAFPPPPGQRSDRGWSASLLSSPASQPQVQIHLCIQASNY